MKPTSMILSLHLTFCAFAAVACSGSSTKSPSLPEQAPAAPVQPQDPATMPAEPALGTPSIRLNAQGHPEAQTTATKRSSRDRVQGKWELDRSGDTKAAAGEGATAGVHGRGAKVVREYKGDLEAAFENDRLVYRIRYDLTDEDDGSVTVRRVGTDEVSNQDVKGEYRILFKDDNTIEIRDPNVQDPQKSTVLILKRQ